VSSDKNPPPKKSNEHVDPVQAAYQVGQAAFERGDYRRSVIALETACAEVNRSSRLGGEVQTWLVTAYEAAGQRTEAIALCRALSQHPDLETRQQARQLLYILEAPQLKTRPEWLTQIPDLTVLADSNASDRRAASTSVSKPPPPPKPAFQLEPINAEPNTIQTDRCVWVALVAAMLVLVGLTWMTG